MRAAVGLAVGASPQKLAVEDLRRVFESFGATKQASRVNGAAGETDLEARNPCHSIAHDESNQRACSIAAALLLSRCSTTSFIG